MPFKTDSSNRKQQHRGAGKRSFTKRREDDDDSGAVNNTYNQDPDTNAVLNTFHVYQLELDERYDKHERLVKKSRDVTIESKRIIFLLHRIIRNEQKQEILNEAEERLEQLRINVILSCIAKELVGEDLYLYLKSCTAGLQEYIEALSYFYYLKFKRLISYEEVQNYFTIDKNQDNIESLINTEETEQQQKPDTVTMHLSRSDYILGIADLTGELMRSCINSIGSGNVTVPLEMRVFLREMLEGFTLIGNHGPREVTTKLSVLRESVDKVENACYAIEVRRKEFPNCKLPDVMFLAAAARSSADYGESIAPEY